MPEKCIVMTQGCNVCISPLPSLLFHFLKTFAVNVKNGEATFTVDSIEMSSYQWQISSDGESFSNLSNGTRADGVVVSGATTETLNLSNLNTNYKNYYFRCKLKSSYNYEAYTNSVVLHFVALFTIDIDGVEKEVTDVYFGVRGKARKITWKGGSL